MSYHTPCLIVVLTILLLAGGTAVGATEVIAIDSVWAESTGNLTIAGTTNIAPGNTFQVEVTSLSFEPTGKETEVLSAGASGTVSVEAGEPLNIWWFTTDAELPPDEYTVTVEWVEGDARASTTFIVTAEEVTGTATATTSVPESPVASPTATTTTPTGASAGGAAAALGLIGAMLFIRRS
ncbi:hypothetical protein [Methanofollis aquaemaris]|uniref:hypothetical protein n=1 Tax=Methanofollis aquaemaris TaxID=126734 RepID=UPI0022403744|nr:hypothetical protein [Methanofollis aquaemaris]